MIPEEFIVDGVPWKVFLRSTMAETDAGQTRRRVGIVLLANDLSPEMRELTFWHELIHAIFTVRGIELRPTDTAEDMEEQVASLLGPALCTFFWHNADVQWRADGLETE